MSHQELVPTRLKMRIGRERRRTLDEAVVCGGRIGVSSSCSIVKGSEYAWWAPLFNEITYDLIIEELDRCPGDLLSSILFLFSLEGQFDEDLLQFLVDIVDTELLERVVLHNVRQLMWWYGK